MSTLLYNVIAAVLALAILYGLNLMSNVKTAVRGNILSAAAMACAILITMYKDNSLGSPTLWVAIALGTAFGLFLSNKVKMIQMPQLVAFLHGFGGGAAALVGLIPNCAASVLLTQLYVEGALRFSSLVAGLCTGAGVGLAVLWRANPSWKQNLFITGLTWAAGAFVGVAMQVIVALFA